MESKRCESCLHAKVCGRYGIFKDYDFTAFLLRQIPPGSDKFHNDEEVNGVCKEFDGFIDDMKREVPCEDYISKANYMHDKNAAAVIENDIRTRCTPDASEYWKDRDSFTKCDTCKRLNECKEHYRVYNVRCSFDFFNHYVPGLDGCPLTQQVDVQHGQSK